MSQRVDAILSILASIPDAQRVAEEVKMEINDDVLLKCAIEATKKPGKL
jgi:hypothetical protein